MITTIDGILAAAKQMQPGVIAVAAAHDDVVLEAVSIARKEGLVTPILVGHIDEIRSILLELGMRKSTPPASAVLKPSTLKCSPLWMLMH